MFNECFNLSYYGFTISKGGSSSMALKLVFVSLIKFESVHESSSDSDDDVFAKMLMKKSPVVCSASCKR